MFCVVALMCMLSVIFIRDPVQFFQIQEKSLDEFSFLIFSDVSSRHSGDYTCVASNMAAKVNHTAQLMVKG